MYIIHYSVGPDVHRISYSIFYTSVYSEHSLGVAHYAILYICYIIVDNDNDSDSSSNSNSNNNNNKRQRCYL